MGWVRRRRALRPIRSKALPCAGFLQPRLEVLESRLYPGDTILGLCALALWGSRFAAHDATAASYQGQSDGACRVLSTPNEAESPSSISLLPDAESGPNHDGAASKRADVVSSRRTDTAAGTPLFADENLARQIVLNQGWSLPDSL